MHSRSVHQITSIAVLPLENLSADPSQNYFADGITDELITALAKIPSLRVVSRTTVMQYKTPRKLLPQIADELGVDSVLEGTVQRAGDVVRVTAQLIYAPADRHIWAERYERRSSDVLLLENELAKSIAQRIRESLSPQQERRFDAQRIDPHAHEAYLRGLYLWNKRSASALRESIRCFQQAIAIDPGYSRAYSGLADTYAVLGSWAIEEMQPEEAFSLARAAGTRSLALDDASAEAHTAAATIHHIYERDWTAAEAEFRRALELNGSYSTARLWYSQLLCQEGRFEECIAQARQAYALEPSNLLAAAHFGLCLYWARRYGQAVGPIQNLLKFDPDFRLAHRFLGQIYEQNHNYDQAISELQKTIALSQSAPIDMAALGHAYACAGNRAQAEAILQELKATARKRYVSSYDLALIHVALGDREGALSLLERALGEHSTWIVHLKVDPRLDPLRSDDRFLKLLHRAGFNM